MQLIRKVEISYFRSVYKLTLKKCTSLNIVSGKNDVGKSNILKALNLFFNGNTDWNNPFDFYKDFSIQRLQHVKKETIKGKQFISIKIEFERPPNYEHSLPPIFSVARTWLRDSTKYQEVNNLENLASRKLLPSTIETARRFLAQFLNRIHYEYVPAVKDRVYYMQLLLTLQSRLLASPIDESALPLVGDLAAHIQNQIGQLKDDFKRATNLETLIVPPQELSSLFQSFLVSTESESGNIPLFLRGDGIQARYVPSVLHYISYSSSDFFVWGFEEPENSLEYSYVTSLANDFEQVYSKDAQIFITSHSPAFISLSGIHSSCYRVYKSGDISEIIQVWPEMKTSDQRKQLLSEIGVLDIQKEIHEQYAGKLSENDALIAHLREIENDKRASGKPLLLVEGKYDKSILETVWDILYKNIERHFIIRVADPAANVPGGGSAGASSVKKMIEALHPDENRKAIALFDRDAKGIEQFKKLSKNFHQDLNNPDIKCHVNRFAYAILLPSPDNRQNYAEAESLTIEFMFPDDVIHRRTDDNLGLNLSLPVITLLFGGKPYPDNDKQSCDFLSKHIPSHRVIASGKDVFVDRIVPDCTPEECESFRSLYETILNIFDIHLPY